MVLYFYIETCIYFWVDEITNFTEKKNAEKVSHLYEKLSFMTRKQV